MNIPAFHRMKHPNRIRIKNIIINFNQVALPVETDKQVFVFHIFIIFKKTVILGGINSPTDVSFTYAMLKSRLTELDVYIHSYTI